MVTNLHLFQLLVGSVLGPLLFTMFVNEVPSIVSSPVLTFADDTKILRVITITLHYRVT